MSDDRATLKGYLQKWRHIRILVGAALYICGPAEIALLS